MQLFIRDRNKSGDAQLIELGKHDDGSVVVEVPEKKRKDFLLIFVDFEEVRFTWANC